MGRRERQSPSPDRNQQTDRSRPRRFEHKYKIYQKREEQNKSPWGKKSHPDKKKPIVLIIL
jgi:hypothetical protein